MGLSVWKTIGVRWMIAMCVMALGAGCLSGPGSDSGDGGAQGDGDSSGDGDGDGSGGGETAGVSNDILLGELTQEQTTELCMHFDSRLQFDDSRGCCVANGVYGEMSGQICEEVIAECEADPSLFDCQSEDEGESSDCANEPPPTCEGDTTVGEVAACLNDLVAEQTALFEGLDCSTTIEEFETLGESEVMPESCDVVMANCPEVLMGPDDMQP